ncbi:MAG: family 20 glycosylhydrolase, partial [Firmicutes bacterium]|nr:family 20 glycosylhydrolase [Bacillota bacterium]
MRLNFIGLDAGLLQGLTILSKTHDFTLGEGGADVFVRQIDEPRIQVRVLDENRAELQYHERIHFFRALGILLEKLENGDTGNTCETCSFDTCGVMFDMSQGSAVVLPGAMEHILERMAVMGLNMLMLYLEDCYVLEGHPYFGYLRPQYTQEDMHRIDEYAAIFGIEVIPCMQSLAHLIDAIKWPPYNGFSDTEDILMVGDERTYRFVEDMIVQVMKPFRSKRIHIGMDEAWKLGRGNYEDQHGRRSKHELMKEHLDRVYQITEKYGLEPMMWSDMFFNTADLEGYGNNYNPDAPISQEIVSGMPEKLGLVFWEYNHTDAEFYDKVIRRHQEFGRRVYFAGSVYNCFGFGVNYGLAAGTIEASIGSCKRNGVR